MADIYEALHTACESRRQATGAALTAINDYIDRLLDQLR